MFLFAFFGNCGEITDAFFHNSLILRQNKHGVITVMQETKLLQSIHKTAEMGCEGILSVLDYTKDAGLKNVLSRQLQEYREFERDAERLLAERGERAADVGKMAKFSARAMSAGKLLRGCTASRIAEMTIEGNHRGISKTLTQLNDCQGGEQSTVDLATRFLSTQQENVRQLQPYL